MQVAVLVLEQLGLEDKDKEIIDRHAEIIAKRKQAVQTNHGEEAKDDVQVFQQPEKREAESIEEVKIERVSQAELKLADQMFYSGAVTSRLLQKPGEESKEA